MSRMTTRSMQRNHRDQRYLRVSGPWKIQFYTVLSLLSILLTPLLASGQYTTLAKPQCLPSDVLYCSPRQGDQFNWTDPITLVWRPSAQPFVTAGIVDVKLWRISDQKLCGIWSGITFADGTISRRADEACFGTVVDPVTAPVNSSAWEFAFKIVPVNDTSMSLADSGSNFYIYRYDLPSATAPPSSPVVSTVVSSTTPTIAPSIASSIAPENSSKSKTLTPLLIAVISGAGIAVLIAVIAIIAATRARKGHKGDPDAPLEASSIHSTTPLAKQASISSFTQRLGNSAIGITMQTTTTTSSIKSNPSPPTVSFSDTITASDAALISDAFRQTLRKPDWKAEDDEDEDDPEEAGLPAEELRRRREAKELMKKELAEEGRGLHSVQRRQTKMLVHKVEEEDDTSPSTMLGPGSSLVGGEQNYGSSDSV